MSNTSVCLLDTGVNNGHPLLAPVLKDKDMHTVDPGKGTHDGGIMEQGWLEYLFILS